MSDSRGHKHDEDGRPTGWGHAASAVEGLFDLRTREVEANRLDGRASIKFFTNSTDYFDDQEVCLMGDFSPSGTAGLVLLGDTS